MGSLPFTALMIILITTCLELTLQQKTDERNCFLEMKLGKVKGSILKSQRGADIYSFRGIHYAQAPVGELRFSPPKEMPPWEGELDATADGMMCPQVGDYNLMSEDCLVLNVYTRNLSGNSAVMVYIHGGGNFFGSSHSNLSIGPHYLMDHDIVLVSLNYRLGALGFMSTGTKDAAGNFGYLDQNLALQWVQKHIKSFGGNPNLVTVFGESAGSMATTLHMVSPLSKGLFHRAIALSGSMTNHHYRNNVGWTQKLAKYSSCPMYNPSDLIECMRNVTWKKIIEICGTWESYRFPNMKWYYEIDKHFMHSHPSEVFSKGTFNRVPLMAGITRDEFNFGGYHQENNTGLLNDISINFDKYAPTLFEYKPNDNCNEARKQSERIHDFYLENAPRIDSTNLDKFVEILSDSLIIHGVHRLIDLARNYVDVFSYRIDYKGKRSFEMGPDGKPRGVAHADDLQYLFPSSFFEQLDLDDPDMYMVDLLTNLVTTFAQTGIPNTDGVWKPADSKNFHSLYISDKLTMGPEPYTKRMEFWDDMFPIKKLTCNGIPAA